MPKIVCKRRCRWESPQQRAESVIGVEIGRKCIVIIIEAQGDTVGHRWRRLAADFLHASVPPRKRRILITRIPFCTHTAVQRVYQPGVHASVSVRTPEIDRSRRPGTLIWLMSRYCNDFASDLRLFIYSRQYWPIAA